MGSMIRKDRIGRRGMEGLPEISIFIILCTVQGSDCLLILLLPIKIRFGLLSSLSLALLHSSSSLSMMKVGPMVSFRCRAKPALI